VIIEEDLILPEWKFAKELYDDCQGADWLSKAIVSLINSIFYQRRVVFVLSKRAFRDLAKSDKNWTNPIGLKDSNYRKLLSEITKSKLVKLVHRGPGSWVYEVTNETILGYLYIDVEAQRNEAI